MSIEAQHAAVATTVAGAVQLRMVACCCGTIPPYHYYYQLVPRYVVDHWLCVLQTDRQT